jgi:rhomboid protease GluP
MANLRMCPHCRAFVPSSERVCTECGLALGRSYAQRMAGSAALAGLVPPTHFTTLILLLVNFALFAATLILTLKKSDGAEALGAVDPYVLLNFGAKFGPAVQAGQWWRLITAGFLHGGLFHILMNTWAMYDLGAQVEQAYGTARFLVFYLAAGAAGFWASAWWSPALSIGASASIFGLIGAMIAYYTRSGTWLGAEMKAVYVRWAIYGLLFGLLPMFSIDNAAHLGGLAAGFGLGYLAAEPGPRAMEWLWRVAAGFAVLIALAAFGLVWLTFPRGA